MNRFAHKLVAVIAVWGAVASAGAAESLDRVREDFAAPPMASRPWCYWYWVNGNVDRETITSDLEAMKRVGFGGLLLLDPRGYDKVVAKPEPKMEFAGPEWVKAVGFAVRECERLGLEFTMNLSDCGGSLKGPWLTGEDGPKRLVCGVNVKAVPKDYQSYHDICTQEVYVDGAAAVREGWRNAGGVTGRWERDAAIPDIRVVAPDTPKAKKVTLRFGYCLIPKREHDVDVIDPAAVERHFNRITAPLFAELGDLVGKTWTHVYSVSWEGAIPTWTATFEEQFKAIAGYELRPHLAELAGFVDGVSSENAAGTPRLRGASSVDVLRDYRRARNLMFKNDFYGTVRRLAHAKGLKLYSESGGPWNRDPSVFLEADQLAFLGVNDMPQGEFWPVRPAHHSDFDHNRPAANAAHIYGLKRASTEAFTHMSSHYSLWPERLKDSADRTFADGVNHLVWHTFTCSPKEFGQPGIEYFAGTHINPNVTWFEEGAAFVTYLARCQVMLQAGKPVTDIAIYGGKTPYRHWGRYRNIPWDGSRIAIPQGYAYDVLNDETLAKRGEYPVFVDGTADTIAWPKLPLPDLEGDFNDFIHRRLEDGTEIYFVRSADPKRGSATFRVSGKVAELWDPVGGTRRLAPNAVQLADGRIRLPLEFEENGSVFVVFRAHDDAAGTRAPEADWLRRPSSSAQKIGGWTCEIGGKQLNGLGDWTKSEDPDIRYFAGKAHYRTTFTLKAEPRTDRRLWLGRIRGGLGRVVVNGRDCGVVWCLPYCVEIPKSALKAGTNDLEVVVVNTWRNRLIGDCFLSESERKTKSCLKYKATPNNNRRGDAYFRLFAEGYSRNDELEPCGLFGPVELDSDYSLIAQANDSWLPMKLNKFPKAGSVMDFSGMGHADGPCGKYGYLRRVGDHFEFEQQPGKRVKFAGANILGNACIYADEARMDEVINRILASGYNAMRIHHIDCEKGILKAGTDPADAVIDKKRLKLLDRFVAKCFEKGIYITLDLFSCRSFSWKSMGVDRKGNMVSHISKAFIHCTDAGFESWRKYAGALLNHVNPHTGRAWKDEPGIPLICLVNEADLTLWWRRVQADPELAAKLGFTEAERTMSTHKNPEFTKLNDRVERKSFARMKAYLDSIGLKALVTDLNRHPHNEVKNAFRAKAFDYFDTHFYFDHPRWMNGSHQLPAQQNMWEISDYDGSKYEKKSPALLGSKRNIPSMPFTVTEWNFNAPNATRSGGGLYLGALAASQEWDGLWRFTWAHSQGPLCDECDSLGFFDVMRDPIMFVNDRTFVALFLRGDGVASGGVRPVGRGTFAVDSPRTQGIYLAGAGRLETSSLAVESDTRCTVAATAVDSSASLGASRRILVTHLTDCVNAGMTWLDSERTIIADPGKGPILVHAGNAKISLKLDPQTSYSVWACDTNGARLHQVAAERSAEGGLVFEMSIRNGSPIALVYEIAASGSF